jgi:hypothetical protein
VLTHEVSIYEHILTFAITPKFFPDGANTETTAPFGLLGPDTNAVPFDSQVVLELSAPQGECAEATCLLSQNLAFPFSGTFQMIRIFETVDGNLVSIVNESVPWGMDINGYKVILPFLEVMQAGFNFKCWRGSM